MPRKAVTEVDTDESRTEIFFIEVDPPLSRRMVVHLRELPRVETAAAVYSGADVVAVVRGSQDEIDATFKEVEDAELPIKSTERFRADIILDGTSRGSHLALLRSACTAFVRCKIRVSEVAFNYGSKALAAIQGVTRAFPNRDSDEIVLEVVTRDKRSLDKAVMGTIQREWPVVEGTRTLVTVNNMRWHRDSLATNSPVFIGTADTDRSWAAALKEQLMADIGLRCWLYLDGIPLAEESWPGTVDEAIENAPLHIFLIGSNESDELKLEIAKAEAIANPRDICILVLPGVAFNDLPTRLKLKQNLDAGDFFAYSKMLDWIGARLDPTREDYLAVD